MIDFTTSFGPADAVTVAVADNVGVLTFNRADSRNALSKELVSAGQSALEALAPLASGGGVRCLIVTAAGDKAFCAGADLKERLAMSLDETRAFLDVLGHFCNTLSRFRVPTIAAINGVAFGGGLEVALCCDIRLAATHAVMGLPEVKLGIIPGAGGTQRLARACGLAVAKGLVLTGRKVDADEALRLGLVSAVVPGASLLEQAQAWAKDVVQAGPLAVAMAKEAIEQGWGLPMPQALAAERVSYEVVLVSQDRQEGLRAFAEKRTPKYTGN